MIILLLFLLGKYEDLQKNYEEETIIQETLTKYSKKKWVFLASIISPKSTTSPRHLSTILYTGLYQFLTDLPMSVSNRRTFLLLCQFLTASSPNNLILMILISGETIPKKRQKKSKTCALRKFKDMQKSPSIFPTPLITPHTVYNNWKYNFNLLQ